MNNASGVVLRKGTGIESLSQEARLLRQDIVEALYHAGGGHYGGCLSVVDIILALYRLRLNVSPSKPNDAQRDRLILSKGHAALALYAVLRRIGYFSDPLAEYANFSSRLEGHPDMTCVPGVDFSTGSLGQGLSVGLGMAYGLRSSKQEVWVILGDGECQEGQVWEAAMLASACKLANLRAVIDSNKYQEWGRPVAPGESIPVPVDAMRDKWRAFGWHVVECDGHDFQQLAAAFDAIDRCPDRPAVIIAHTTKGRGSRFIESDPKRFHCETVAEFEHLQILKEMHHDEAR